MNNYTSYHNLQLIKMNLIDVFAEYLRYKIYDKTEKDKIIALVEFTRKINPIKNLDKLTKMRKFYENN